MPKTKQSEKVVTSTQSFTLVKNMFRLAVSSICFLRQIFPPSCFKTSNYGGQPVHQLQCAELSDGKINVLDEDAFLLSQWLERSVFDALEKQYLRSMTFWIYQTQKDGQNKTLEEYSFTVEYPTADCRYAKVNKAKVTMENTKQQAVSFIRCLVEFTNTLETLPEERFLTLKLEYYEDRTPADYEPIYFTPATDDMLRSFVLDKSTMKIRIAKLGTADHNLSLSYKGLDTFLNENLDTAHIGRGAFKPSGSNNAPGSASTLSSPGKTKPKTQHNTRSATKSQLATVPKVTTVKGKEKRVTNDDSDFESQYDTSEKSKAGTQSKFKRRKASALSSDGIESEEMLLTPTESCHDNGDDTIALTQDSLASEFSYSCFATAKKTSLIEKPIHQVKRLLM
jgi:hypothetical protein